MYSFAFQGLIQALYILFLRIEKNLQPAKNKSLGSGRISAKPTLISDLSFRARALSAVIIICERGEKSRIICLRALKIPHPICFYLIALCFAGLGMTAPDMF